MGDAQLSQPCRDLVCHRRLARAGAASDEQQLRSDPLAHLGSPLSYHPPCPALWEPLLSLSRLGGTRDYTSQMSATRPSVGSRGESDSAGTYTEAWPGHGPCRVAGPLRPTRRASC